jgi:hypothetical protein
MASVLSGRKFQLWNPPNASNSEKPQFALLNQYVN